VYPFRAAFQGHVRQLEIRDAGCFFRHLHTPMDAVVASAAANAAVSTELGMGSIGLVGWNRRCWWRRLAQRTERSGRETLLG
jgi:hypothetical protein